MKKGVTFITHIYEARIESRHKLLDLCDVDVANRETGLTRFVLILHQPLVLKQSNGDVLRLCVNN